MVVLPILVIFPTVAVFYYAVYICLYLSICLPFSVHYSSLHITSSIFNFLLPEIHQLVVLSVIKPFKHCRKYFIFLLLEPNSKLRMFFLSGLEWYPPQVLWLLSFAMERSILRLTVVLLQVTEFFIVTFSFFKQCYWDSIYMLWELYFLSCGFSGFLSLIWWWALNELM